VRVRVEVPARRGYDPPAVPDDLRGPVTDRRLLLVAVGVRALSIGLVGVLLAFHLDRRGFDEAEIAWAVSAGLWGMAASTAGVGAFADRVGRRRSLVLLALLSAAGVAAATFAPDRFVLLAGAFLGMLNGAGRDRGGLPSLEQPLLASTTDDATRTQAFAWYHLVDDACLAAGPLLVGVAGQFAPDLVRGAAAQTAGLLLASGLMVVAAGCYARLSPAAAGTPRAAPVRLSPETRRRVWRLSALFALDGFGGGLVVVSLLAVVFHDKFGTSADVFALLVFGSRILNAVSHLGAAWLAKRIGLVNTMVFTHAPSSVLLFTVAVAPTFPVAAVLYLLREGLVEMDVPTRTSYLMAIVKPEERTRVTAITNLVRMASWATAAWVAGLLMRDVAVPLPLAIAAGCKLLYDGLLWAAFRRLRPPEEGGAKA